MRDEGSPPPRRPARLRALRTVHSTHVPTAWAGSRACHGAAGDGARDQAAQNRVITEAVALRGSLRALKLA